MTMTFDSISADYKQQARELIERYGSAKDVPRDVWDMCTETARTRYILMSNPDADVSLLRQYGVPAVLIQQFMGDDEVERKSRRADKYKAMVSWCQSNVDVQVTPDEMCEIGGVSRTTALKFMQDRVDLFRKIKRGVFEVRDPEQERAADK